MPKNKLILTGLVIISLMILLSTELGQNLKIKLQAAILPNILVQLTNSDRNTNNLNSLKKSHLLQQAAQLKANDMAAKGYFSHNSPDGKTPWYWLNTVGYKYVHAGENLAVKFSTSQGVEAAWMKSPEHKANILGSQFTEIGIATAQGIYKEKETTFVVQFFGQPQPSLSEVKNNKNSVITATNTISTHTPNPSTAIQAISSTPDPSIIAAIPVDLAINNESKESSMRGISIAEIEKVKNKDLPKAALVINPTPVKEERIKESIIVNNQTPSETPQTTKITLEESLSVFFNLTVQKIANIFSFRL